MRTLKVLGFFALAAVSACGLAELPDSAPGYDAGTVDAGKPDATLADTGSDTTVTDTGSDTTVADTGSDTATEDTGSDTAVADTGSDTGPADAGGADVGAADAGFDYNKPCTDNDDESPQLLEDIKTWCNAPTLRANGNDYSAAAKPRAPASYCAGGTRHYQCLFETNGTYGAVGIVDACGAWTNDGTKPGVSLYQLTPGNNSWPPIQRLTNATKDNGGGAIDRWVQNNQSKVKRVDKDGKSSSATGDTRGTCVFEVTKP